MKMATCWVLLVLQLNSISAQNYTQWTGYGNISDLLQLPTNTEFRIRHIGGKYLYQNIGPIHFDNEFEIYARCDLDSLFSPISYWTIIAKDPLPPNPFNHSKSRCIPDITSYEFKSTKLLSFMNFTNVESILSVCGTPDASGFKLYTWGACGWRQWLPTNCDEDLKVVTVYDSLFDYPRYYTQLRVFIDPNYDPFQQPVLSDHVYYCPTIPNTCYDPDEVEVIDTCEMNSYDDSLWTFEVNAPPDMTINGGLGPTKYYEGYSYLTNLSDGDVVVIRLISGMLKF